MPSVPERIVVVVQRTSGPREQDRVQDERQQPERADGDRRLGGGPQKTEHGNPRVAGRRRRHQRVPVPAEQTAGVDAGCCENNNIHDQYRYKKETMIIMFRIILNILLCVILRHGQTALYSSDTTNGNIQGDCRSWAGLEYERINIGVRPRDRFIRPGRLDDTHIYMIIVYVSFGPNVLNK